MIFKYTVANKEGKKLSGTVEAPDIDTAKAELNNLGFSIFNIEELKTAPKLNNDLKSFVFEAIDKNGKLIAGTVPAEDDQKAFNKLQNEYNLNVTALWKEGLSENAIQKARQEGTEKLREQLVMDQQSEKGKKEEQKSLETEKEEQILKIKIDHIIQEVNEMLKRFEKEIDGNQRAEINKKIDKLLRIKNSNNLEYILQSAQELLQLIQEQEKFLREKGFDEKRFEFKIETKKLLDELNQKSHQKTLSEDIVEKIEDWQKDHGTKNRIQAEKTGSKFLNIIFEKIKAYFVKAPEVIILEEKIKANNQQIFDFIKLYFKENDKQYREKVKNSIKIIWETRKKTKIELKELKKKLSKKNPNGDMQENFFMDIIEELNIFSGWLLAFYLAYYFVSLYLSTKNFGLTSIPDGFQIYNSQLFKYTLAILFILHISSALKVNFFQRSVIANILLPIFFIFASITALLNF